MASAQKAETAADASPPTLEATWTPAPAVHRRTEPALPSLAASWTPTSPISPGSHGPEGRDRPAAASHEAEADHGSTPRREAAAHKPRSRAAGDHPAPDQRPLRRFRKRKAKGQPDRYPSEQDARACGLFI